MKILYVITQADGGGAQKYVLDLAKKFNGTIAAGAEADMLFLKAEQLGLQTIKLKHLRRNINPWHDLMALYELHRLYKKFRPDIIHLNSSKAGVIGSFAAIFTKSKVIFTAHGFVFNEPLPLPIKLCWVILEKLASFFRDKIICVSEADLNSAQKYSIAPISKLTEIPNGIDQISFLDREAARNFLGIKPNEIIVGTVANDYPSKGLKFLKQSYQDGPVANSTVVVIGKSNNTSSQTIKFLGPLENAAQYLKAFDIFCLPSVKEGFPYTILEAEQAGLPIVATNVGGIPEAVGNAALLVPSMNSQALKFAITKILNDQDYKNDLSRKALAQSERFKLAKTLDLTQNIYEQLNNT